MELSTYFATLRRHWLTVVVTTLLAALLGALAAMVMPKTYESSAGVAVSVDGAQSISDLSSASNYLTDSMPTYASLGSSSLVLDPVIKKLGLTQDAAHLAKSVTVQQEPETFVLSVGVEGGDPQLTADIAQAVADQLATDIPRFNRTAKKTATMSPPEVVVIPLNKASVPESAASPNLPVNVVVGLVVGALLGCALAVLRGHDGVAVGVAGATADGSRPLRQDRD